MEITSAVQKLNPKTRPFAKRRRSKAKPQKKRTAGHPANGFLTHRFLPFHAVRSRNYRDMEAEFFRSLGFLCDRYGLPLPDTEKLHFPLNVTTAYMKLREAVKERDKNAECIIISDERHSATLALLKRYDTGRCLYYIPVRPLWNLLQTKKEKPLSQMLVCIYAYLYQIAKVPYYTESNSYLFYQYEVLQNWIDEADDEDPEEAQYSEEQTQAMHALNDSGNSLATIIGQTECLDTWEASIETYRQSEDCHHETLDLAEKFLSLFKEFPERTLFDNIHDELIEPEETDRIQPEQYISFYWSGNDCFYDMLFDIVNSEFQECAVTDEPTSIQLFDVPQSGSINELDFEKRLFDLIDRLCSTLEKYDHE